MFDSKKQMQILLGFTAAFCGCTFNFDVTTQRTALENQIMGRHTEISDDLILNSSVRGPDRTPLSMSQKVQLALQNQKYNRDDIDEFKLKQILGESNKGTLAFLPRSVGSSITKISKFELDICEELISQENSDRKILWQNKLRENKNLSRNEVVGGQITAIREQSAAGTWYQDDAGKWVQKDSEE